MRRLALALGLLAIGFVPLLLGVAFRDRDSPTPADHPPTGPYRGSEPPAAIRAPDFRLLDYRGRTIQMRSLRGRVVLVTFLDTDCKTKCPIVAAAVGAGLRMLQPSDRKRVTPLAITVDPPVDTPRRIRSFLARRHALGLDYLIGTTRQLRPVWKAFGVLSAVETGDADLHSSDVRIFDQRGIWVSTLHASVDLSPANLAHDLVVAIGQTK